MKKRYKILHFRSSSLNKEGNGAKVPSGDLLSYGEIAINYLKDYETFFIKNTEDEVIAFKTTKEIENNLNSHIKDYNNPHQVTKEQIGLGNVNNTSDLDKPISNLAAIELNNKINSGDVIDNLVTNDSSKPLSANQGKILKELIDNIGEGQIGDISDLLARVASLEEELEKGIAMADIVIKDSI